MLLDRRRINRYWKWVALAMAIIFGLSFVMLGIGSGLRMSWWSELFNSGSSSSASANGPAEQIKAYEDQLATDPNNVTALLGIAKQYEDLQAPGKAAPYLEQAAQLQPTNSDLYLRLGRIYLAPDVSDYASAVTALNKYTSAKPDDPEGFLRLGVAQRGAGNAKAAVLAWSRYLELAPQGDMAETVKTELAAMKAAETSATAQSGDTTATAGKTTSTTGGTTTTTK